MIYSFLKSVGPHLIHLKAIKSIGSVLEATSVFTRNELLLQNPITQSQVVVAEVMLPDSYAPIATSTFGSMR